MKPKTKNYRPEPNNMIRPKSAQISKLREGDIRLINLGGVEECGKNMLAIEYMNSLIVVNTGVQFSASKMPGVDFIIPNVKYLEDNKDKIKGVIYTSSSLENTGALPFINTLLGSPRIYARHFTNTLIQKRVSLNKLDNEFIPIEEDMSLNIGEFDIYFYGIKGSNPDYLSFAIKTSKGNIVFSNDNRIKNLEERYEKLLKEKTLCLISDSLNTESSGNAMSNQDLKNQIGRAHV